MATAASPPRKLVRRFTRTERALHWVHASAFFLLLGSGLVLYVPALSEAVARRQTVKAVHIYTAIAWLVLIVAVVVLGDRRALRQTAHELDVFDRDDRLWLRGRRRPQGRFNAGQKLNAALTASFALLFAVSGSLLWLGERDTRFRWASTVMLHDGLMFISIFLVLGHLYLALIHPTTRQALRGMTLGTVDAKWAERHHQKWAAEVEPPSE
ncbi:MAG: formate dehydrogenase subunit gamma [Gaiellaceae bacterium]|jgi:formate dehydrogenase subunit gamma|nr:formate dehydrogenase subunit gamma [Gaiellaceae bacterium]